LVNTPIGKAHHTYKDNHSTAQVVVTGEGEFGVIWNGELRPERYLQGMFGAALVPLSQSVLLDIYPKERQGSAMALWGIAVMVGPVLGPVLGGWLTENYTWRWVFYINLPIGVLAFHGITTFLPETQKNGGQQLDWFGFGTLSLAIGALQVLLDRGEQLDWFGSGEIQSGGLSG
jgi:DHA2 family multidrug resistance protein